MEKNVGNTDAFLRSVLVIILLVLGLLILDGIHGNLIGILVALVALMPLYMVITRKCFVFKFLKISSISKHKR